MNKAYSVYQAKAKLSELLRNVKRGREIVVTEHGKPIAKVIPFKQARASLEDRIRELRSAGLIRERKATALPRIEGGKTGALARFLRERA